MSYERISIQEFTQVTINDDEVSVQAQEGPVYLNTYGPGGPVMNEFVSPEYDSFNSFDGFFYVDALHNLTTDRIVMNVEEYLEVSAGVWEWKRIEPADYKWISDNTRRLYFYPEPVKIRCYFIGGKSV